MNAKLITWVFFSLATGLLGYLFLPLPGADPTKAYAWHIALGFTSAIFTAQAIALWYFLSDLKVFKKELRIAYYILSVGLVLLALTQLQLPLLLYLNQALGGLLAAIIVMGPMLLAPLAIYAGVRRFARLLDLKSRWRSVWRVIAFSIILSTTPTILSYSVFQEIEAQESITFGLFMGACAFVIAAVVLMWRIRSKLSPAYEHAMKWLTIALCAVVFFFIHEMVNRVVFAWLEPTAAYTKSNITIWPLLLAAILFIKAGMEFKAIKGRYGSLDEHADPVSVVTHIAKLASTTQEIDPTLDKVRKITANKTTDALTDADRKVLAGVYLDLEKYLVNKEPLRKFSQEDLRSLLPNSFSALLNQ